MAIVARWTNFPGTTWWTLDCGRRGCTPGLGITTGRNEVLLRGFVYDGDRDYWRLGNRAQRQWEMAKRRGDAWSRFTPTARGSRIDMTMGGITMLADGTACFEEDGGTVVKSRDDVNMVPIAPCLRVRCPVCGWVNDVPAVPSAS